MVGSAQRRGHASCQQGFSEIRTHRPPAGRLTHNLLLTLPSVSGAGGASPGEADLCTM